MSSINRTPVEKMFDKLRQVQDRDLGIGDSWTIYVNKKSKEFIVLPKKRSFWSKFCKVVCGGYTSKADVLVKVVNAVLAENPVVKDQNYAKTLTSLQDRLSYKPEKRASFENCFQNAIAQLADPQASASSSPIGILPRSPNPASTVLSDSSDGDSEASGLEEARGLEVGFGANAVYDSPQSEASLLPSSHISSPRSDASPRIIAAASRSLPPTILRAEAPRPVSPNSPIASASTPSSARSSGFVFAEHSVATQNFKKQELDQFIVQLQEEDDFCETIPLDERFQLPLFDNPIRANTIKILAGNYKHQIGLLRSACGRIDPDDANSLQKLGELKEKLMLQQHNFKRLMVVEWTQDNLEHRSNLWNQWFERTYLPKSYNVSPEQATQIRIQLIDWAAGQIVEPAVSGDKTLLAYEYIRNQGNEAQAQVERIIKSVYEEGIQPSGALKGRSDIFVNNKDHFASSASASSVTAAAAISSPRCDASSHSVASPQLSSAASSTVYSPSPSSPSSVFSTPRISSHGSDNDVSSSVPVSPEATVVPSASAAATIDVPEIQQLATLLERQNSENRMSSKDKFEARGLADKIRETLSGAGQKKLSPAQKTSLKVALDKFRQLEVTRCFTSRFGDSSTRQHLNDLVEIARELNYYTRVVF